MLHRPWLFGKESCKLFLNFLTWLHSIATRFGSIAAQDRQFPYEKTGFLFVRCKVTRTGPIYVGRAMGQYSRIVYAYTYFDGIVAHGGWDDIDWNTSNNNKTMFFGVYKCWGPGAVTIRGVPLAQELDFESAHLFLVNSFVNGRHWIAPSDALLTDNIPINQRKKNSIGNCTVTDKYTRWPGFYIH
ncbi:hypothetical protein JHK82_027232 [Glycine max]|nr:hypothetical protein JHK82_027232 [Glycine max]